MDLYDSIVDFWFGPPDAADATEAKEKWFRPDAAFDAEVRARFLGPWETGVAGELRPPPWGQRETLGAIILFDQFPRNMFRGKARAYESDELALTLARASIEAGHDRDRPYVERVFHYLPFEHSEDLATQREAMRLFQSLPDHPSRERSVQSAAKHLEIIERFGRFPHRNEILGRESTPEEIAWLEDGGERFGTDGKPRQPR